MAPINAAKSIPPGLTAGSRWRRCEPGPVRVGVFILFDPLFQNVPEAGEDRLIGAPDRLVDAPPVARARLAGEAAHNPGGEVTAGQIAFGRVAREPPRKFAADRHNRGAGHMRIGTGPDDLANDHGSL